MYKLSKDPVIAAKLYARLRGLRDEKRAQSPDVDEALKNQFLGAISKQDFTFMPAEVLSAIKEHMMGLQNKLENSRQQIVETIIASLHNKNPSYYGAPATKNPSQQKSPLDTIRQKGKDATNPEEKKSLEETISRIETALKKIKTTLEKMSLFDILTLFCNNCFRNLKGSAEEPLGQHFNEAGFTLLGKKNAGAIEEQQNLFKNINSLTQEYETQGILEKAEIAFIRRAMEPGAILHKPHTHDEKPHTDDDHDLTRFYIGLIQNCITSWNEFELTSVKENENKFPANDITKDNPRELSLMLLERLLITYSPDTILNKLQTNGAMIEVEGGENQDAIIRALNKKIRSIPVMEESKSICLIQLLEKQLELSSSILQPPARPMSWFAPLFGYARETSANDLSSNDQMPHKNLVIAIKKMKDMLNDKENILTWDSAARQASQILAHIRTLQVNEYNNNLIICLSLIKQHHDKLTQRPQSKATAILVEANRSMLEGFTHIASLYRTIPDDIITSLKTNIHHAIRRSCMNTTSLTAATLQPNTNGRQSPTLGFLEGIKEEKLPLRLSLSSEEATQLLKTTPFFDKKNTRSKSTPPYQKPQQSSQDGDDNRFKPVVVIPIRK